MTEESNTEDTLAEYGYSSNGVGRKVAIAILVILFVGAAIAALWMGRLWSNAQSDALTAKQQLETFTARVSELENKNAELSSLLADKQAETERLREEWTTQVDTLKTQHTEQLQRTYAQMNEIVYDSRKTISYIGDIETRLRDGQNIDSKEAAELQSVVNGLVFLHEQYKKPLTEFRELNRYFNQQLAAIPAGEADPIESTPLGKRIFQNKKFKEERNQYFENQGRRSALTEAQGRVAAAYSNAQQQMAGVSLDINQYLAQLEEIINSNEQSTEDVAEFFETSKEILKIHDKIMSIDPPKTTTIQP
ncbi:MAG: hypothetical protein P1U68_18330 [Verrucomicrobiales bacterium]|nr:hypothetical protein [Verrucomicrobiales bacterium]